MTIVARDNARMLVLLKGIRTQLTVPVAVPRSEMAGQWTIAVGRTFDGGH